MNEIEFNEWLTCNGVAKKVRSDLVCRIKRLERAFGSIDVDEEYAKDGCAYILSAFQHKGINPRMLAFGEVGLPIGKYHLSAYKHALRKYISFIEEVGK